MTMDEEQNTIAPDGRAEAGQPAWRKDFPIDTAQDAYVARRDFTKFLVLISAAFTTGQIWIGVENWRRGRRGKPPIMKIVSLKDLPVGASFTFRYPGAHDDAIIVRPSAGTLVAYGQKCTHLACPVIPDLEDDHVHEDDPTFASADAAAATRHTRGCFNCPAHHGKFDLLTGRPIAGPPRRPLPRITLQIRGDDIFATGVELRTI